MTPEERQQKITQLDRLKKLKQLKSLRAQKAAEQPVAAPEGEGFNTQDIIGGGTRLLSSQLAGFGDEFIGAARTGMEMLNPSSYGEGTQDFADTYEMYRDDARASAKEFQEENPLLSLTADVTGAIANPLNKVAPGFGSTGRALPRVLAATGRGTAEGALYGLGEGEGTLDEQLDSAKTGAMFGGGTAAGLSGVGGLLGKAISKRRIAQDLGRGADQIPLNLADPEGGTGKLFRNFLARAYGAQNAVGKQESQYLNRAPKLARFAREGEDLLPKTQGTQNAINQVKKDVSNKAAVARSTVDDEIKGLKQARKAATADIEKAGVRSVIEDAMPSTMPQAAREEIFSAPTQNESIERLSKWWGGNGFATVKDGTFQWNKKLRSDLAKSLDESPELKAEIGKDIEGGIEALNKALNKADDGAISGDTLMAIRNQFAQKANKAPSLAGKGNRTVSDRFDDMIEDGLGEGSPEFVDYQDQLRRWASNRAVVKAASAAEKQLLDSPTLKQIGRGFSGAQSAKPGRNLAKAAKKQADAAAEQAVKKESLLKNKKGRLGQVEEASKNRIDRMTAGLTPEHTTPGTALIATGLLGAPLAGLGMGAIPAGVGVARGLASKPAQRAIAGQTKLQEMLAEAIRNGNTALATRLISRLSAQTAGEQ